MPEKKRLLIIGTAQQVHIRNYLAKVDRNAVDVLLLLPERDRGEFRGERTIFFKGSIHALFPPLLKAFISFKPHETVIVCGMTYDHDNVVRAVGFYCGFCNTAVSISVRNKDFPADTRLYPNPIREIFKWFSLGTLALLIKGISLFKKIRVGEIYSTRLGHLALDCEIYLSEKQLGLHSDSIDLFSFKDGQVANRTLAGLFAREMRICSGNRYLLDTIRMFNMTDKHEIPLNTRLISLVRDYDCVIRQTDTHISFTPDEMDKGKQELKAFGLDPELPHVCLLGRDSAFLQNTMSQFSDRDMQEPRNMDIRTFRSGAEKLLDYGYNVIRTGNMVKEALHIDHPNFMDYATSGKCSDFMDIHLHATCSFFVGVQSGPQQVANIFRRPCLRVNVARIEVIEYCSPYDLAIFKLIWSKSEKRILQIPEILQAGIGKWPIENFADSNFEVIDNTEDELEEAIKEMHLRVSGQWHSSPEEEELQQRYRSYFKVSDYNSRFETPISTYFLRKHADELFN